MPTIKLKCPICHEFKLPENFHKGICDRCYARKRNSRKKKFHVLDLFAGVGGTAKGIQKFFFNTSVAFEYTAVDNNSEVLKAHRKLNPFSITIEADAWSYPLDNYNFIWASPPCTSHSQLNMYWNRREPDMRLWDLIKKLQQQKTPFVLENVEPYYKPPIKPTFKIGRHWFWSNKTIVTFEVPKFPKKWGRMYIPDWEKHHEIDSEITNHIKEAKDRRQHLRNMVHWTISYRIIKQILFPKQTQKTLLEVLN